MKNAKEPNDQKEAETEQPSVRSDDQLDSLLTRTFRSNPSALESNSSIERSFSLEITGQEVRAMLKEAAVGPGANQVLLDASMKFAKDAHSLAAIIACRDEGAATVTQHHAMKAVRMIWLRESRLSWFDAAIGIGGILAGLGLDKCWEAPTRESMMVLIVGAVLLTWGLTSKGDR